MNAVKWQSFVETRIPRLGTWERGAARVLANVGSFDQLINKLAPYVETNTRIMAAQFAGSQCHLFDPDERRQLHEELSLHASDFSTNDPGYAFWHDDDEEVVTMAASVKHSLALIEKFELDSGVLASMRPGHTFNDLADQQRDHGDGCIYTAGNRCANLQCIVSEEVGLLHSALPADIVKAGKPGFHKDHAELIVATSGTVELEYSDSLDRDAVITTRTLRAGDYQLLLNGWPHRISAARIRDNWDSVKKEPSLAHGSFLAVKCGELKGKSREEDMSRWPTHNHPLIRNWQKDCEFLASIDDRDREILHLPPNESSDYAHAASMAGDAKQSEPLSPIVKTRPR